LIKNKKGGKGARDLGKAVIAATQQPSDFKFLYPLDRTIKQKVNKQTNKQAN